MHDNAILENGGTLNSVPDCYKNQEMCNKAVDHYPHALEFVLNYYMTQKMSGKVVNTHSSTIQFVSECYKTQEMYDKAFIYILFIYNLFLHLFIFLVNIKLKKCVTVLSLKILFQ